MIYYCSATGNSEWVAKELAAMTGDQAVSITGMVKNKEKPRAVKSGETLGLVFPVYAWAPPRVVTEFVKRLEVEQGAFVYGVCTMGKFAGNTFRYLNQFLPFDSCYSIVMPENYIVMSDSESNEVINAKVAKAKVSITFIGESVKAEKPECIVTRGPLPFLFTSVGNWLFNSVISDKAFYADSRCTGCGLCARLCPLNNISQTGQTIAWHGNCMHCMSCIQNCPAKAIEYGQKTCKRKRYRLSDNAGI